MKQVTVRIREYKNTGVGKITHKAHFMCLNQFRWGIADTINDNLMPGQEVYIRVGRNYSKYISYEDIREYTNENNCDFETAIYDLIENDNDLNYHIKEYLRK